MEKNDLKIKMFYHWDWSDIYTFCNKYHLFTAGCCSDYEALGDFVNNHKIPEINDIYYVADNIKNHSDNEILNNHGFNDLMYLMEKLDKECCYRCYMIV